MFNPNTKDAARTLDQMIQVARSECNYSQPKMIEKVAGWLAQDRRFDHVGDKRKLAQEAMDARAHGRTLNLSEPYRPGSGSVGYVNRRV